MSFDVRTRLSQLKNSARHRGLNVNLDINKYQYLISHGCYYCGDNLENEKGYCLDRIDSSKGYNYMNVVACCGKCNRAKGTMTPWEFATWLKRANDFTQNFIAYMRKLESFGITEEKYNQVDELFAKDFIKDMPKLRIKEVNS